MKDVNHFNLSQQTNNPLTEGGTYSQLLTKPKKCTPLKLIQQSDMISELRCEQKFSLLLKMEGCTLKTQLSVIPRDVSV